MKHILLLAWRYVCCNKLKTVILVSCLTITLFLPLAVHFLIKYYNNELVARAKTTPLVVGAKGNRYDLILKSLYFTAENPELVKWEDVLKIRQSGLGEAIPLHIRYTAQSRPIVGTSLEYFSFRGLKLRAGSLPQMLGDVVLGVKAAESLGLSAGDVILSDQRDLYDISSAYPLKMTIVGVLAESGTADDYAVFVDVKTAWVIEGLGHGHTDLSKTDDENLILKHDKKTVVGTAAVVEYREITEDNIDSFHFHGAKEDFPLTSVVVLPYSHKAATILKSRYNVSETRQMLVPMAVMEELMGIVFKVKRFFDANFAMITLVTILFMALVVLLSLRIRKREMETMFKIGCSRMTVFLLQTAELSIVVAISLILAGVFVTVLVLCAPEVIRII